MLFKKPISLVLGSGGARGLAHLGVLRVLEREKIPIKQIVGTSMGAVVGAAYAQTRDINTVEQKFRDLIDDSRTYKGTKSYNGINKDHEGWFEQLSSQIKEQITMNIALFRNSLFSTEKLRVPVKYILDDSNIEDTKIPFTAISTDLLKGSMVLHKSGPIIQAVISSASIPGFFPPIKMDDTILVDGAYSAPVPITIAKQFHPHTKVVAVDVSGSLESKPDLDNSIDIVLRSYSISSMLYHNQMIKQADVLIQPEVSTFHWSEFEKIDYFITEGIEKAEKALKNIKSFMWF